jgi:hypothetical protein
MLLTKIFCSLNLAYAAASVVSFIVFRFETAAFWGQAAYINLGVQLLFAVLVIFMRSKLSPSWKIACGCGILLNMLTAGVGLLFMSTYAGSP